MRRRVAVVGRAGETPKREVDGERGVVEEASTVELRVERVLGIVDS